jgi:hypothetical protein
MDLGDEFQALDQGAPQAYSVCDHTTQAKFMLNLESSRGNVEEMECAVSEFLKGCCQEP